MEAPDFIREPSGQVHHDNIDKSPMRAHEDDTHDSDSNLVATLSHENAQTGQKFKKLDEYPPSIYCEDLESRNGTYVNDTLIGILGNERIGHLLVDGDLIEIRPDWKFRFHQPRLKLISHMSLPEVEVQYFKDRFTISDHVLGSGIAGEVFLAKNVVTSKQIACKVVKIKSLRNPLPSSQNSSVSGRTESNQQQDVDWERKSYLREIDILSKLNHPNIISIQKAFLSNDRLYMFTELAAAGDLYTYFDSCNNRLGDTHARLITRQIALALEYLHSKGIAHRDIKMENILITNTDIGSRVILTDFGLANHVDKTTGRLFSAVGTEGYVAPEIVGSDSNLSRGYTTAADMWSFGILTWSLLTGETSIPRGRLSQLEEIQITKNFLSSDEKEAAQKWSYLHSRARSFLRGLLASDAGQRMTAVQTVNHPWYKKPPVSTALEQAYDRVTKVWKPRNDNEDTLEFLPGYIAPAVESVRPVRRKRLPDVSLSPYFNLDRHLQSRSPQMAKRRRILDDLKESGESFVDSDSQQDVQIHSPRRKNLPIKSVPGIDLFGSYKASVGKQAENNTRPIYETSSREDAISETGASQKETKSQIQLKSSSRAGNTYSSTLKEARARKETDPASQGIHDAASQRVTRFCSAKAFKDEVNKIRKEKNIKA
ncbi:hypothetical protein NHQ30_004989 [Ciborinia camelliae]|nr:hypothetical protein NHQ30_004989 [Ciborinia camelliae]